MLFCVTLHCDLILPGPFTNKTLPLVEKVTGKGRVTGPGYYLANIKLQSAASPEIFNPFKTNDDEKENAFVEQKADTEQTCYYRSEQPFYTSGWRRSAVSVAPVSLHELYCGRL